MVLLVVETPTLVFVAFIIHNVELAGQPSTRPFAAAIVQRSGGKLWNLGVVLKGLENTSSSNSDSKFNSSKKCINKCVLKTQQSTKMGC